MLTRRTENFTMFNKVLTYFSFVRALQIFGNVQNQILSDSLTPMCKCFAINNSPLFPVVNFICSHFFFKSIDVIFCEILFYQNLHSINNLSADLTSLKSAIKILFLLRSRCELNLNNLILMNALVFFFHLHIAFH